MNGIWPVFSLLPQRHRTFAKKRRRYSVLFRPYIGLLPYRPAPAGNWIRWSVRSCTALPDHAASPLMTRLQGTSCARSLSGLRPVNSLPVRWTGYLTRRRASALPLLHARFCAPSVTRWSLLPARYGTGFSSEPGGDVPGLLLQIFNSMKTLCKRSHTRVVPLRCVSQVNRMHRSLLSYRSL